MTSPSRFRQAGSSPTDENTADAISGCTTYSELIAITGRYSFADYKAEQLLISVNSVNSVSKRGFRSPKGTRTETDRRTEKKIWEAEKRR